MFNNIVSLDSDMSRWVCLDEDDEPIYCGCFITGKSVAIEGD